MTERIDLDAQFAGRIDAIDARVKRLETLEFASVAGGAGAWVEIETITIDAPATTFSFLNIPQTYLHLAMILSLRGTGLSWWRAVYMRLNNNSDDRYWYHTCYCQKGTPAECVWSCDSSFPTKTDAWKLFFVPDLGDEEGNDPDCFSAGHLWIPDYRNQYKKKSAVWDSLGTAAVVDEITRQIYRAEGGGVWHDFDPITRIDVYATVNFERNSKVSLYGIQGTFEEF